LDKAIAIIEKHPENWNQMFWHCGTVHCIAGHVELILNKLPPNTKVWENSPNTYEIARLALGISTEDADTLFDKNNTLKNLKEYRTLLAEKGHIN
jgi:hypothetical protein